MSHRGSTAPWLAEISLRLGVDTDATLAAEVGVTRQRVALVRRSLGIPPAPASSHKPKGGPRGGGRPRRVEPETAPEAAAELRRYVPEGVRVVGDEVALTVPAAREIGRKLRRRGASTDTERP